MQDENQNGVDGNNEVNNGDIKYKIDGFPGVERVKIDWHDWDQIGSDLRRYNLKNVTIRLIIYS